MSVAQRFHRLRNKMEKQELDALVVTDRSNIRYLSGVSGYGAALLITMDRATMLHQSEISKVVGTIPTGSLGFESGSLSVASYQLWERKLSQSNTAVRCVLTKNFVEELRETKDSEEIDCIRKACSITEAAFNSVICGLEPSTTEQQAAWMFEKSLRELGAEDKAFDIVVAAGSNASTPHPKPTEQKLGIGHPVIVDLGAVYNGYCADMSRTFVLGKADQFFWRASNAIKGAMEATVEALHAGKPVGDADVAAREYVTKAGFGEFIRHDTGHGIGLSIHEQPYVSHINNDPLSQGSVFTVEPGIYIPEWGGIRMEDVIYMSGSGPERLTVATRTYVARSKYSTRLGQ